MQITCENYYDKQMAHHGSRDAPFLAMPHRTEVKHAEYGTFDSRPAYFSQTNRGSVCVKIKSCYLPFDSFGNELYWVLNEFFCLKGTTNNDCLYIKKNQQGKKKKP